MEFFKTQSRIGFMRVRKGAYVLSVALFVISLGAIIFKGLNLGVDFTGGVTIEAKFSTEADLDRLRRDMAADGFTDVQVQNFGSSRDVAIRLPPPETQTADEIRAKVEAVLRSEDSAVVISRVDVVGPQVGAELRNSAIVALASTLVLIFIYVFIRFHAWQLSMGAIMAAIHDPIIVIGFFALTGVVFDLSVIAATLAVIGYSLNDTVVVFDRIRERFDANKRLAPTEVLDQSVNQTLSRTIMTSGTTLIVVLTLLLIGGPALQGFSIALVVGILVGTYSSIYIASASALDAGLTAESLFPPRKKLAIDDLP
ncbi:MAG: protein translocase subunit SecF [Gammaproteobacteria bacterium]|nr:protein translocase subunit SecF [Gammaproteobacteria bacterium]